MTLTSALRTANSSLASHSQQISNLSRNISGIGDPTYVRRQSSVQTALYGSTRVETQRYVNRSIHTETITSGAKAEYASVVASGLDRLAALQGKNNFATSPAKLLGDLKKLTEFAAASPSDTAALTSLVERARTVATSLNSSYDAVLEMKENADKEILQSVNTINSLLAQIKEANDTIVNATRSGNDAFDSMDIRDQLVDKLSKEIGIKIVPAEHNNIIITTNGGALLFEGEPRSVSFQSTPTYGPTTTGGELRVDGVIVTGANARLGVDSGKIAGHFEVRDKILVAQQNQLDEVARGLVDLYSEKDQTGGGKPALAGLFTWSGGPAVPAAATLSQGIASTIRLNPLADPQLGGNPALIRDGALNGDADYTYNTAGGISYSDRLYELANGFSVTTTFAAASGLPASQSLSGFAASSVDSLNAKRTSALSDQKYRTELAAQFKQSLQSETGPNLDYEMSRLLEVERAYQASAKMLTVVDQLYDTLLGAVT